MTKRSLTIFGIFGLLVLAEAPAQEDQSNKPVVHVDVNLVLLNVGVTDNQGHYVTGLRPSDFAVFEDNIPQKLSTFAEGNAPQQAVDSIPGDKLVGTPEQSEQAEHAE